MIPETSLRQARSRLPVGSVAVLATGLLASLLTGCQTSDNEAAFRAAAARPVMLNLHRARDEVSAEPLRALTPSEPTADPVAALGQRLYHDVQLSGDDTVSCASCHDIAKGGDDGLKTSTGIKGSVGPINAPTVLNSAFNFRQFWDGRAATLAEQAKGPVTNPLEMGAAWPAVIAKLAADDSYTAAFTAAFGDGAIDEDRIATAIARFEETLITPAPFDRYLLGDQSAISAEAKRGYELFKSHGCVACHQGVNVGGNLYQKFGALQSAFEIATDADKGRHNVTRDSGDVGVFKVPSLRNVALTAPYFHLGTVTELKEAVRIMGSSQLGRSLPDDEIALIVAFLNSLTGEVPQLAANETSTEAAR